jgi:thiol-disulfide isomerase/thioredoxin
MKTIVFASILLLSLHCSAQQIPDTMPHFKMVLPDGTNYTYQDLKKDKPTILIYFSPDCGHCQALMKEFFQKVDDFNKAQVVMITFKPLKEIIQFVKDYQINRYHNIKVGTETPMFFIRYYYNLTNTPFTVLFNKKGKVAYSYRQETSVTDLISRLNGIK